MLLDYSPTTSHCGPVGHPISTSKLVPSMAEAENTIDARQRLLSAATQIFADKGYALASTREICRIAGVNAAAIHYYFGDKASLYREVFRIPELMVHLPPEMDDPHLPTLKAMQAWYSHMMSFAVSRDQATRLRLLFLREQVQPSGVLEQGRADILNPYHHMLVRFLVPRLGCASADVAIHHLAFSLIGIAMVLFVEQEAVTELAPGLLDNQAQIKGTVQRLAHHATAIIEAEQRRRVLLVDRAGAPSAATAALKDAQHL